MLLYHTCFLKRHENASRSTEHDTTETFKNLKRRQRLWVKLSDMKGSTDKSNRNIKLNHESVKKYYSRIRQSNQCGTCAVLYKTSSHKKGTYFAKQCDCHSILVPEVKSAYQIFTVMAEVIQTVKNVIRKYNIELVTQKYAVVFRKKNLILWFNTWKQTNELSELVLKMSKVSPVLLSQVTLWCTAYTTPKEQLQPYFVHLLVGNLSRFMKHFVENVSGPTRTLTAYLLLGS